ncbi:MAG: primase protein [Candidatus Moranbacteria bacterium GW2011_GWC2_37_73]|nr:MAG: DNA primase, DNA primase [Parcubacteria group bacterium GW2011_GWC1_36_108]KKQ00594.1 MAG: primase protein [Candidatus Moranbacteria bacterium GW2011_GWD1_36_198]KKQ02023.1 MAG: primase protein [Candidatus Moranbacteria bacterium GW2011_GWD2_36_198]KKQ39880.1 MAG: primase protein [Candidatus Moranbacteria bacterium GW2011_GWC2_37_73]HAS00208.1 DNA primase [Candidatus Moranbacteria bacterium]
MNNNVEEIKSRLNIVDIVGEYVRLTKAGSHWKGLCPFHNEKSPSFMVNEEKQIFHCFGCAKGGDVFSFVQEIESMEFREVLKILAEKAGVQLEEYKGGQQPADNKKRIIEALELATKFYETQLWKGVGKDKILQYLHERGLNDESIQNFRLGYAPNGWDNIIKFLVSRGYSMDEIEKTGLLVKKENGAGYYDRFRDRIMFPITDVMGNVVGYSARVAPGGDESQAKYVNTPETLVYHKGKVLYGLSYAKSEIKKKNYVLLVEGNMDVIASVQAGITNTVAVSGTALTGDQITMLKRYTENIAMLFDMDSAGQAAAQKSADLCLQKSVNVKIVTLQDGKDAADVVAKDPELLLSAVKKSVLAMEYFFNEALKKYDKKTADGKMHIAKEVLSHVANIENQIEKAHWIKKIAHTVEVEEKVVTDVLKAVVANAGQQSQTQYPATSNILTEQEASFQKRSDAVRNSLIGLVMSDAKIWKENFETQLDSQWVKDDSLVQFVLKNGAASGFSFDNLLASIDDDRAIESLRKIYFNAKYLFTQEGVVEYSTEELRKLVDEYISKYIKELQKEKLYDIIKQIENAEQKGDKETLAKLMSEFTKLSQEMQS